MGQSGERSTCHERKPAPLWLQGRGWEDRREDCTCSFGERAKMNTWVSPPPRGSGSASNGLCDRHTLGSLVALKGQELG